VEKAVIFPDVKLAFNQKGGLKMPLNVRRFLALFFLVLVSCFTLNAQTSADVMRERVAKAKAFIAVKNYNAAIYELENIRRESKDATVHGVVNVLLMNSYLEQSDYKRAQAFLNDFAAAQKANKPNAVANYMAVAAQVVKGAKNQSERYKALGLSVSDRNLPVDAATDLENMRVTLELVVEQSKVLGKDKTQTANAMALLEEATNARSALAKDDYDAKRWKDEIADARETLATSRSVIINAVNDVPPTTTDATNSNNVAANTTPTNQNTTGGTQTNQTKPAMIPVPMQTTPTVDKTKETQTETSAPKNETVAKIDNSANSEKPIVTEKPKEETKKTDDSQKQTSDNTEAPPTRSRRVANSDTENNTQTVAATTDSRTPLEVGSLIDYATQKVNPTYPVAAKTVRQTGIVKVELVIDEQGLVSAVQKASGPALLQGAAKDAIKKWKFKPFTRDGQPVKATGFVSFNFNL
jgi:periplasmic protein TonB